MSDPQLPTPDPRLPTLDPIEPPKRALFTIFFIVFIDLLGFGIIIPLLPFYIHDAAENPMKVTLLFSIYSICQFIGAPVLGLISDRHGRKPVLAFSQAGSALGYALLGIATQFHWAGVSTALVLIYLSRIIDGFTGGNISTAQAYISDVTTQQNRSRGMGLLGAAFGLGFSFGPFLGGVLGKNNVSLPAYAAGVMSTLAMLMSILLLVETPRRRPTEAGLWLHPSRFAPILRDGMLMQLLLISFVSMAAFVMMEATSGLYLIKHYGFQPQQVGWFFGYIGLVIVVVQGGFIRHIVKRRGDWPAAVWGPVLVAIGMLGYASTAFKPGSHALFLVMLFGAGAINAVGRSCQQPTLSSIISRFSRPGEQGVVFGFYHGMGSIARIIGPLIAGVAFAYCRNTLPFILAAVGALACAVWMATLRRRQGMEANA